MIGLIFALIQEHTLLSSVILCSLLALCIACAFLLLSVLLWISNRLSSQKSESQRARWQELLFDHIADPQSGSLTRLRLARAEVDDYLDFLLELSRRFQGTAQVALSQAAAPFLKQVLKDRNSSDEFIRARSARVLGTLGLPAYTDAVRAFFRDPSPRVRIIAFRCLILRGGVSHLDEMLASLSAFPRWNSNLIASFLSTLGPSVAPRLREYFAHPGSSPHVKAILAITLRQLNDPLSVPIALSLLQTEKDPDAAASCLRLLQALGSPEHAPEIRRLCRSNVAVIQAQAIRALGRLGDSSDIPLLSHALEGTDPWIALHAASSLKEVGGSQVLAAFADSSHPHAVFAREVLEVLQ